MKYRDFRETCWETAGLTKTADGHYVGEIIATGAGVFSYYDDKGNTIPILRSIDEVKAATAGIADLPITLLHPSVDVDESNIDRLKVGSIGHEVVFDGLNNKIKVDIYGKEAVEAIDKHKVKAVSMGYDCVLVKDSGNWQGTAYAARQTKIEYNHMALVTEGRAGDGVRFRIRCGDSADFSVFNQKEDKTMKKTTLRDGSIVEIEESVFDELKFYKDESKSFKDMADEKQKTIDSVTGERDAAKASLTKTEKEFAEFKEKALDAKEIDARVKARLELLRAADEAGIEKASELDDNGIRTAIIAKAFDSLSMEGKSDEYIAATYAAACAQIKKGVKDGDDHAKNKQLDGPFAGLDSAETNTDEAYRKMCDALDGKTKKEA